MVTHKLVLVVVSLVQLGNKALIITRNIRKLLRVGKENLAQRGRIRINYLHIGKTGGSQISHQLEQANQDNKKYFFVKRPHRVRAADLAESELWFCSVRDPISRFYSGFYSRKRMGRPRNNFSWSPGEEIAFGLFPHANDLAEALDPEHAENPSAVKAMSEISHINRPMTYTLGDGHLSQNPIFVIRQEHLNDDLRFFFSILGMDFRPEFSERPIISHRNDYSKEKAPPLSEHAKNNLASWYREDFLLMETLAQKWDSLWQESSNGS